MKLNKKTIAVSTASLVLVGGTAFAYVSAQSGDSGESSQAAAYTAPKVHWTSTALGTTDIATDGGAAITTKLHADKAGAHISHLNVAITPGDTVDGITYVKDTQCPIDSFQATRNSEVAAPATPEWVTASTSGTFTFAATETFQGYTFPDASVDHDFKPTASGKLQTGLKLRFNTNLTHPNTSGGDPIEVPQTGCFDTDGKLINVPLTVSWS